MNTPPRFFALVPAAGTGTRMGSAQAKQYLPLLGHPLIAHALRALCAAPAIDSVFVVLAADDEEWPRHDWSALGNKLVPLACGGATRAESVVNGLQAIGDRVAAHDWILVHDAARPCLSADHLDRLLHELAHDPVGGILAQPVADTLKRADRDGGIEATVSRQGLWQAQTPQMFRHGMLLEALSGNLDVTDEAGAIEALGYRPRLVASDASNLKVTWPQDMQLAGWILAQRNAEKNAS